MKEPHRSSDDAPSSAKGPASSGRPREAGRGSAVRDRIIQGAARVFAERGVEATSVEDLLVAAGVSRRTFYRFFASKDDVLDLLHEVAATLLIRALRKALDSPGGLSDKLRRCVETYLGFSRSSGPLMRALAGEAQRPSSRLASRRLSTLEELITLINREVRAAFGYGVDPLVLRGLILSLEGITRDALAVSPPGEEALQRAEAAMLRILLATLLAGDASIPSLPRLE